MGNAANTLLKECMPGSIPGTDGTGVFDENGNSTFPLTLKVNGSEVLRFATLEVVHSNILSSRCDLGTKWKIANSRRGGGGGGSSGAGLSGGGGAPRHAAGGAPTHVSAKAGGIGGAGSGVYGTQFDDDRSPGGGNNAGNANNSGNASSTTADFTNVDPDVIRSYPGKSYRFKPKHTWIGRGKIVERDVSVGESQFLLFKILVDTKSFCERYVDTFLREFCS